ncbi:MAG: hypothetical protein ABIQ90_01665 [Polaromonas sp.]
MSNRTFSKGAACVGLILALAACGGDSGVGGSTSIGTSQPLADSFFLAVLATIATSPDDVDAKDVESIKVTSPEDTDAVPVGS